MEAELRGLRRANNVLRRRCRISAVENEKISGDKKWWGTAHLVAYQVRTTSTRLNPSQSILVLL